MEQPTQKYKDYYYILGVAPEATTEEIAEAYAELNAKFGPHVSFSGQDPQAMINAYKDICEAFEVLGDAKRRQEYDQSNLPHLQKTQLRQLWGKVTGANQMPVTKDQNPAQETRVKVEISLKEAVKGGRKSVHVDDQLPCESCMGKKPVDRVTCPPCLGSGVVKNPRDELIEIPPGLFEKKELRKDGLGKFDARCNRNGDLVIEIAVAAHPFFVVVGKDVSCTVPISVAESIVGGEIEVPTITGRVIMKIQPLTPSGKVYRLKGMGLGGGDLMLTVEVQMPQKLSADEVALYQRLKAISSGNPREEIFAKLSGSQ